MGLAVCATRAKRVSDSMFLAAAHALAKHSPAQSDPSAPLLPLLPGLRKAAIEIAIAAAEQARLEGFSPAMTPESLRSSIVSSQWSPQYSSYL